MTRDSDTGRTVERSRRKRTRSVQIKNLGVVLTSHENVRRLDIAMNDAFGMRRINRIRDFNSEIQRFLDAQRTAIVPVFQCLSIEVFHHNERTAVVLTDIVDRANLRMIERRGRTRLDSKSFERLRILGTLLRQELHRNRTAEADILRFIDNTHASGAEMFKDFVVRNGLADHRALMVTTIS